MKTTTKRKLKDIFFGNIDAKNELLSASSEENERFLFSFSLPPTVIINDIISGRKYFITGMKGIGKTALLKYLELKIREEKNSQTAVILFKTDISAGDRRTLLNVGGKGIESNSRFPDSEASYEDSWQWFIYRVIIESSESSKLPIFEKNRDWDAFSGCVRAPLAADERSGLKLLIPKINKGKVKIAASPSLELDFDWHDKEKKLVDFSVLTKQAAQLFRRLVPTGNKLTLFIDELEPDVSSPDSRLRDIQLIRDFIIMVERFNSSSLTLEFPVRITAAVRSEVLSAIEMTGKEVNKVIADFGVPIIWHRGGVRHSDHPLLQIVEKRLAYSEREDDCLRKELWDQYFSSVFHGKPSRTYVLDMTWLRPRDIVRLLNIARDGSPNDTSFNGNVMAISSKEYSHQSWLELVEEMSIRYSVEEIEGVQFIFSGFTRHFSRKIFYEHVHSRSSLYPSVAALLSKHKSSQILIDCYNAGIIGNTDKSYSKNKIRIKQRFHFRGDYFPILDKDFIVHNALCPFFGIK